MKYFERYKNLKFKHLPSKIGRGCLLSGGIGENGLIVVVGTGVKSMSRFSLLSFDNCSISFCKMEI